MALVKNNARITLPSGSMEDKARVLWMTMREEAVRRNLEPVMTPIGAGYVMTGSVPEFIRSLWPGVDPRSPHARQVFDPVRQYLSRSGNVVIRGRAEGAAMNKLFIRSTWSNRVAVPVSAPAARRTVSRSEAIASRESKITPHEAGEDRPPAPVTVRHVEPVPSPSNEVSPTSQEAPVEAQPELDLDVVRPDDIEALSEQLANVYRCDQPGCPRTFSTKRGLAGHRGIHVQNEAIKHGDYIEVPGYRVPESIPVDGGVKCAACGVVEPTERSLGSHKRLHYSEARHRYLRTLEAAAREVKPLRSEVRKLQVRLEEIAAAGGVQVVEKMVEVPVEGGAPMTIDSAMEFIREQVIAGDDEIRSLNSRVQGLEQERERLLSVDAGEANATVDLIREAFLRFVAGDMTMPRFATEVEDALRLFDPNIPED